MPSLTIKNVPDDLYDRLRESANEHRRSLKSEVIVCLERALRSRSVDPEAFLARIDALHKQLFLTELSDEILLKAKEEGRP